MSGFPYTLTEVDMEIIKHGQKPEDKSKQLECARCGCVFIAKSSEYIRRFYCNDEYYTATCPECGFGCCCGDPVAMNR